MASLSFTALSLRPRELSSATGKQGNIVKLHLRKKPISVSFAANSPEESSPAPPEKPEIELEFIGPKPGDNGSYPVERAKAISGDKLLRNIMLDNKIELYATYGKVMNCGGGGSCGTCIVEIMDGKDLLNERTNTELRLYRTSLSTASVLRFSFIQDKPESWRLACQTIVGNKENSGKRKVNTCLTLLLLHVSRPLSNPTQAFEKFHILVDRSTGASWGSPFCLVVAGSGSETAPAEEVVER
ncbi:hypothetical protein CJ030_MR8G021810 [Morella rubra]|uniref:Uncharacterized protein n=1 Tax=Morella rubra TaxID=262757 RepID=A0A6A1UXK9_9ROSI|nr:hypothetical protein CJ030_MR8G021810 [Morella rubra]